MGRIVGATFCTHVPRLMMRDREAQRRYMQGGGSSFVAAYDALNAERVEPLDFDTFVVVDTHWFTTLQCTTAPSTRCTS